MAYASLNAIATSKSIYAMAIKAGQTHEIVKESRKPNILYALNLDYNLLVICFWFLHIKVTIAPD